MNILIVGDSFAANYGKKDLGWVNHLANDYKVINLAQAGCSQYKIYLQLTSTDLKYFDAIIISHTSPNRWYTSQNLIHRDSILHNQSDYIYSDVVANMDKHPLMSSLKIWFENFHDLDYADFVHNLICKEITELTLNSRTIHLSFFDYKKLFQFNNFLDLSDMFLKHRGDINHLDSEGNLKVYQLIKKVLENPA